MIKVTGIARKEQRGPARVFNREEEAMAAVTAGMPLPPGMKLPF